MFSYRFFSHRHVLDAVVVVLLLVVVVVHVIILVHRPTPPVRGPALPALRVTWWHSPASFVRHLLLLVLRIKRLLLLSVEHAAKATVHGILTNEVEFTIPHISYFTNVIRKLFPVNISDSIKNIFYVKIMLPPREYQDNLPNMSIINRTVATN